MRNLTKLNLCQALFFSLFIGLSATAQEGKINIQQDPKIAKLVEAKTQLNRTEDLETKYKIQIYNGTLEGAKKVEKEFKGLFDGWPCDITFETPNYKVRVGKFKTRLEADKNLMEIKKEYANAFILIPK